MERHLSTAEVGRYYEGFSNGVLWPVVHYLLVGCSLSPARGRRTGRSFKSSRTLPPKCYRSGGDLIWVHGYQLMLVFASCYAGKAGIQPYGSRWSPAPPIRKIG